MLKVLVIVLLVASVAIEGTAYRIPPEYQHMPPQQQLLSGDPMFLAQPCEQEAKALYDLYIDLGDRLLDSLKRRVQRRWKGCTEKLPKNSKHMRK